MRRKSELEQKKKVVFIQPLSSGSESAWTSRPKLYIVSLDNKNFYKVRALNPKHASNIVMDIGKNPPPKSPPPHVPGTKIVSNSKVPFSAVLISRDAALQMLSPNTSYESRYMKRSAKAKHSLNRQAKGKIK